MILNPNFFPKENNQVTSATKIGDFSLGAGFNNIDDLINKMQEYSQNNSATQYEYNKKLQDDINNYNATQAQINREFQERMSNTQYQRAVKDLEKAGLNKLLAYSNLSGSVPSGSLASSSASSVGRGNDITNLVTNSVNSANQDKQIILKVVQGIIKSILSVFF